MCGSCAKDGAPTNQRYEYAKTLERTLFRLAPAQTPAILPPLPFAQVHKKKHATVPRFIVV